MDSSGNRGSIPYMERTRRYYRALGYDNDYAWAQHEGAPFTRLEKPLHEARIALVTTAGSVDPKERDAKGKRQLWSGEMASPPARFETEMAWDKESTHTDDRESFCPTEALTSLAREGVIGGVTRRFHGVPNAYSQRKTMEQDAPDILRRMREDGAEAAILTAL